MRLRWAQSLAILAALAVAAPAMAQDEPAPEPDLGLGDPPPDDGTVPAPDDGAEPALDPEVAKEMAKRLLDGADEFFKKGDYYIRRRKPADARERYERALAAYAKAFELVGNPKIYYPMASTEEKLELWVDAALHYRGFLAGATDADPKLRLQAASRLDTVKLKIGQVTLAIMPEGTTVTIDGTLLGTAPLPETLFLAPGDHQLALAAEGYQPFEHSLTVEAGSEAERTFELEPVPAVIIDTPPPPPPRPPPPPALPSGPSKLPWLVAGGAAIGLAGGATATGILAISRHNTFTDSSAAANRREAARTNGKSLALVTDAMIAGSVITAGVATWYYLKVYRPKARAHAQKRRERAAALEEYAGATPALRPKLLVLPWVEVTGSGAVAGFALGGSL